MTRVLLIAYYFPPIGGAGSQRSLKLAQYLPDSGLDVSVLTGPGTGGGRWSPRDETLAEELPPSVQVHRLGPPEPPPSSGWRGRAERWLRLRSAWSRWWVAGLIRDGVPLAGDADLVIASMSPYETARAAMEIARRTGKPWVADLRDPWALDEMMIHPTSLHRSRELARMRKLLGTSAAMVATTPEAVRLIRARFPELAGIPAVSIPNGFDAHDFSAAQPRRDDDAFRIVHTGYLHTDIGEHQRRTTQLRALLGGGVQGVDIMARSHVYLLEALEQLVADPTVGARIELHLAGVLSESDRQLADRYPFIEHHGYVTHAEAVGLMRSADLLFLPMQKMPPGSRSSIVPGKTYEYLAARRPILAAVPEGDAREILVESGMAHVCAPDDPAGMVSVIRAEIERRARGEGHPAPNSEHIEGFDRQVLVGRYAALLQSIVGTRPALSTG